MAYDPSIDGSEDAEITKWSNERLRKSIELTNRHMARGANPQIVIEHESKDGTSSRVSVGSVRSLWYEDRDGVGYAVGDAEFTEPDFDTLIATNRFPRRSAEFWRDNDHMSEVALLGRKTPRRPLPDLHFGKSGGKHTFSQIGTKENNEQGIGGGGNAFVPGTENKEPNMSTTIEDRVEKIENAVACMAKSQSRMMKHLNMKDEDEAEEPKKDENAKPSDGISRAEFNSLKEAHSRMEGALKEANERADKFALQARKELMQRQIDSLRGEGVVIADADVEPLVAELAEATDPNSKIEFMKRNFARVPVGKQTFAHMGALPASPITKADIDAKVQELSGDPDASSKLTAWMKSKS